MADIAAPAPVPVGTGTTTIWTNPSNSGRTALVKVAFNNIDSVADCALNTCLFVDANPGGSGQILAVGYVVKKLDGVEIEKVLEPGDAITASASAPGDIVAIVDVFWAPE